MEGKEGCWVQHIVTSALSHNPALALWAWSSPAQARDPRLDQYPRLAMPSGPNKSSCDWSFNSQTPAPASEPSSGRAQATEVQPTTQLRHMPFFSALNYFSIKNFWVFFGGVKMLHFKTIFSRKAF